MTSAEYSFDFARQVVLSALTENGVEIAKPDETALVKGNHPELGIKTKYFYFVGPKIQAEYCPSTKTLVWREGGLANSRQRSLIKAHVALMS